MKTLVGLLFLVLNFAWASDLSSVYFSKFKESSFSASEIKELKKYKVLLVPGVLAESFDGQSGNQIKVGFIFEDAFHEQKTFLTKEKIDFSFAAIDTESPVEVNALTIISEIEKSQKTVLIYSHSKGGLDTLEALRLRPELVSKVHGWVSVQSPFWGSDVASLMYDNDFLRQAGKSLFEWMGGSVKGMEALTIKERSRYMDSADVRSVIKSLDKKLLNYASYKPNAFGVDTPLEIFRNITQDLVGNNDGVVSLKSAMMKEHGLKVNYVIEKNVDHLMTMTKYRPDKLDFLQNYRAKYDQQRNTMTLLKMIL